MNIIPNILSDKVTVAMGWNILHILWQGLILVAILAISLRFLKRKSAQVRYLWSVFSLLIMIGLSIYNFTVAYNRIEGISAVKNEESPAILNNYLSIDFTDSSNDFILESNIRSFKKWLEKSQKHFPLVVNFWLLGVLFFISKFILSYLQTNKLKSIKTSKLPEKWIVRFRQIESKLNIKKQINYIESKLIKVPVMLGYFKPVIIIPLEMISGIPSNQIEAIVAHELAHIKRNDYIVNVIQTIIETIFFFHPAVWYISAQIRNERENCCDDLALTVSEGSLIYAKALLSVQELSLGKHYSAVAFSGSRKKYLLNRIKRMIMKPKTKSNYFDKMVASLIILSGIMALSFTFRTNMTNYLFENEVISSNETNIVTDIPKPVSLEPAFLKDTIKKRKKEHKHEQDISIDGNTVTSTHKKNGKKEELKFSLNNGKVSELHVNGNKIPEKDYEKYQGKIDETIEDLKEAKVDIKEAMQDIEDLDIEEIRVEIEEAMKNIHIDVAEMEEEIAHAMEIVDEIDIEKILKEVEVSMDNLKDMEFDFDFDFDTEHFHIETEKIHEELERVKESLKNEVDQEVIKKEILRAQENLMKINEEEIIKQIEEGLKHIENLNTKDIEKELEEQLRELEELELEEKK